MTTSRDSESARFAAEPGTWGEPQGRLTGAAALVAVPHAGHYLQRDAPDAVMGAIEAVSRSAVGP